MPNLQHRRSWRRYAFALAVCAVTLLLTLALPPLGARPYVAFIGAVTLSAWYGGVGPTLVTAVASVVTVYLTFENRLNGPWLNLAVHSVMFLGASALIAAFAETRSRGWRDANQRRVDLEHNLAMLRAISEATEDSIFVKDLQGRLLFANPASARMLGTGDATLLGKDTFERFGHTPEATAIAAYDQHVIATGLSHVSEEPHPGPSGTRTLLTTRSPMRNAAGAIVGIVGIAVDITDRIRNEEILQRSHAYHAAIADLTSDFAFDARVDADGGVVVEAVSEGFTKLLGYTMEELTAAGGWQAIVQREPDAAASPQRLGALLSGEPARGEIHVVAKDGRTVLLEYQARPVFDAQNRPARLYGAARDITAQRQAEVERSRAALALRESEERARVALDIAQLGTWTWDPMSDVVEADARVREVCGFPDGPLTFDDVQPHVHADDWPTVESELRAALRPDGDGAYASEFRFVHDDGTVRWVVSRGQVLFAGEGPARQARVMFGSVLDITERKQWEGSLLEADRRKDEFIALLAHELRNPLAPIRTALEILKRRHGMADDVQRLHAVMDRQVDHLVRLVDDLLDVSRVLRGRIELRRDLIDITEVVALAIETTRPVIDLHRHELHVSLPEEPITVHGDAVRLSQVLANVLNNAAKYTERHGRIDVFGERDGDYVLLRVRDNGVGIPADVLPRIFEPFVQGDRTLERSQGGLGIGLSLVQKLVDLHGGSVRAISEGPGRGTEVTIRLPAVSPRARSSARLAGPVDRPATHPARILVVDDNADAAESLVYLLRAAGHDVQMAHNGPSALQLAAVVQPHAVLLDIGLPGMNGYEVAERLRQQPADPRPLLVAITGYGQQDDRRRALEAGFDHHFVKPVDIHALESLLVSLAASS
jgi:PAS domain S-box-containing protein